MTITLLSFDELMARAIPEPEYIIDGMFTRGSAVLLAAREKAGKGFIMLDVAVSIALGESFLGRPVPQQGAVIYLALEESLRTVRDRLRDRANGRAGFKVYVAPLDGSEGCMFRLGDPESIRDLALLIQEHAPMMVIIDTLREAHTGRENESDDMPVLLRPIRQLAHETNTCIVVTHHSSKAGGFRGSTSIPAAFDDVFEFTRDDLDRDTDMRGVLVGRGRDLPKLVQYIGFDSDTHRWRALDGAPVLSSSSSIDDKILRVLNSTDDHFTAEVIAENIPDTKLKTVQNKLSEMVKRRPCPFLVLGSGTKGDPKTYHGIHKREFNGDILHDSSASIPGTIGNDLDSSDRGQQCIECGTPVTTPGSLYCLDHGDRHTVSGHGSREVRL